MAVIHIFILLTLLKISCSATTCRFVCREKVRVVWKKCIVLGEDCSIVVHPGVKSISRLEFNRLGSVLDLRKFPSVSSVIIRFPTSDQILNPCGSIWTTAGSIIVNGKQCDPVMLSASRMTSPSSTGTGTRSKGVVTMTSSMSSRRTEVVMLSALTTTTPSKGTRSTSSPNTTTARQAVTGSPNTATASQAVTSSPNTATVSQAVTGSSLNNATAPQAVTLLSSSIGSLRTEASVSDEPGDENTLTDTEIISITVSIPSCIVIFIVIIIIIIHKRQSHRRQQPIPGDDALEMSSLNLTPSPFQSPESPSPFQSPESPVQCSSPAPLLSSSQSSPAILEMDSYEPVALRTRSRRQIHF